MPSLVLTISRKSVCSFDAIESSLKAITHRKCYNATE